MPSSLKGAASIVMPVDGVMSGESTALPKRAYLVFRTLVLRPDKVLNSARILRTSVSWASGCRCLMNRLMSSAYASISFL